MNWITTPDPDGAHVWNVPPFHIQIRKGGNTYPSRWVATWNLPLGETTEEQVLCPLTASEDTAKNAALTLAHQKAQQTLDLLAGTYTPPRHGRPPKSGERRLPWAFSAHPAVMARLKEAARKRGGSIPDLIEEITRSRWTVPADYYSTIPLTGGKKQKNTILSSESQKTIRELAGRLSVGEYLEAWLDSHGS